MLYPNKTARKIIALDNTMSNDISLTKGERTANRVIDAAETLFARKGYDGTSLREIAKIAGIKEPGLYRYFTNKEDLYRRVLERGLRPLADRLDQLISEQPSPHQVAQLPLVMIDLLAEHPDVAILLQQALASGRHLDSEKTDLVAEWLEELFNRGKKLMLSAGFNDLDDTELALRVVNFFNLCAGFFSAQHVINKLSSEDCNQEMVIERQKQILSRIIQIWMII